MNKAERVECARKLLDGLWGASPQMLKKLIPPETVDQSCDDDEDYIAAHEDAPLPMGCTGVGMKSLWFSRDPKPGMAYRLWTRKPFLGERGYVVYLDLSEPDPCLYGLDPYMKPPGLPDLEPGQCVEVFLTPDELLKLCWQKVPDVLLEDYIAAHENDPLPIGCTGPEFVDAVMGLVEARLT